VAAYLARYTGTPRDHTTSDLRCYLSWCDGIDAANADTGLFSG